MRNTGKLPQYIDCFRSYVGDKSIEVICSADGRVFIPMVKGNSVESYKTGDYRVSVDLLSGRAEDVLCDMNGGIVHRGTISTVNEDGSFESRDAPGVWHLWRRKGNTSTITQLVAEVAKRDEPLDLVEGSSLTSQAQALCTNQGETLIEGSAILAFSNGDFAVFYEWQAREETESWGSRVWPHFHAFLPCVLPQPAPPPRRDLPILEGMVLPTSHGWILYRDARNMGRAFRRRIGLRSQRRPKDSA